VFNFVTENNVFDDMTMPGPRAKLNRIRCGECEACNNTDCGCCKQCLRKVKFGGDGTGKEACVRRRCRNLKDRSQYSRKRSIDDDHGSSVVYGNSRHRRGQNDGTVPGAHDSPKSLRTNKIALKIKAILPPKINTRKSKSMVDQLYGRPLPKNPSDVCAGCCGARDMELHLEPILLCDGPGCGSEYHLQCCLPEFSEVPNEEYYCIDCSPKGSTGGLEEYFDKVNEDRANFENSHAFVEAQLKGGIMQLTEMEEENETSTKGDGIPLSELDRLSKLHHDALTEWKAPATDPVLQTPDFLVGKAIRIYCPNGNQYHTGRIVDWRKAGHCDKFWGATELSRCEFLVRFLAGMDSRKAPHREWIILEEHSCAIGVSVVWALRKRSWKPAMTWLRTSLELLPVRHELSERLHQIYTVDGEPFTSAHTTWSLVNFFGNEKEYALVSLQKETTRFDGCDGKNKTESSEMLILKGLTEVELKEQDRIQAWHKIPLANKAHSYALTIADESNLAPIDFEGSAVVEWPVPVQLLPLGLDRMWLMAQFGKHETTKDQLVDVRCQIVKPGPHLINLYFEQAREAGFGECEQDDGGA